MALVQHDKGRFQSRLDWDDPQSIHWKRFLKRPIFTLCPSDCYRLFAGKTVFITGAAGSIGSALALSMMEGLADRLVLLDRCGKNMERLHRKYQERNLTLPAVEFVQADVLRQDVVEHIFSQYRPDIIFHAAAAKHLPELESNPLGALKNNVLGTIRLFEVAAHFQTECFLNVSTDKAVNPTSILGASKRLAELFLVASRPAFPRSISLRLGNVLGSSGSVVPLFVQAIRDQQPLPITDPLASRYFLTVEEAVALLLQSSRVSAASLLLPEMGCQRKIIELAAFLLDEVQHENDGAPMSFTGLRDGEKPFEELTYDYEYLRDTDTPGMHEICGNSIPDPERFIDTLHRLLKLVTHGAGKRVLDYLLDLVPEFLPSPTLLRHLK